jgi:polysaccharide pyruvyl transferase WcaK-like protein
VLTNRVHGAVCAAGFGIPSVIIGNDTRAMIGDYIGIPRYKVTDFNVSEITDKLNSFLNDSSNERSRLLELRDLTITRYKNVIEPVIEKMDLS